MDERTEGLMLTGFEYGERGHEPRSEGDLQKPGRGEKKKTRKGKEAVPPLEPPGRTRPCQPRGFSPARPGWVGLLAYKTRR